MAASRLRKHMKTVHAEEEREEEQQKGEEHCSYVILEVLELSGQAIEVWGSNIYEITH